MKNSYLRAAMILGTISLILYVPSTNIIAVIGTIFSWVAYSNPTKNSAFNAMKFYIAAAVIYAVCAIICFFCFERDSLLTVIGYAAGICYAVAVIPTVICALLSYKGGKELEENDSGSDGFFE